MIQSRRRFLQKMAAAPLAAQAFSSLGNMAFAADGNATHTVVVVFLRGAMDSLSALVPSNESAYYDQRPGIRIPREGQINLNGQFAMHDAMRPLYDLYLQGDLAFVVGTGLNDVASTRSHFDAQARMEAGLDGSSDRGWLGRHLLSRTQEDDAVFRSVGVGGITDTLRGYTDTLSVINLPDFRILSPINVTALELDVTLSEMYAGTNNSLLREQSDRALNTLYVAAARNLGNGDYGENFGPLRFGREMSQVAELVNSNLGLEAVTVDMGGWDMHDSYGTWQFGAMREQLTVLSNGLRTFYDTIQARSNVTVVVMSEFGRRLEQNSSYGTDHGKGGAMMLLGAGVNGGRVTGQWNGLQALDDGDLPITTDYRQILAELVDRRLGNAENLGSIFPGYTAPGYLDLFS